MVLASRPHSPEDPTRQRMPFCVFQRTPLEGLLQYRTATPRERGGARAIRLVGSGGTGPDSIGGRTVDLHNSACRTNPSQGSSATRSRALPVQVPQIWESSRSQSPLCDRLNYASLYRIMDARFCRDESGSFGEETARDWECLRAGAMLQRSRCQPAIPGREGQISRRDDHRIRSLSVMTMALTSSAHIPNLTDCKL
jgi:hypothetical protein